MWSLGKVFKTPEVVRVYIGSFWDRPYVNDENAKLFTVRILFESSENYFSEFCDATLTFLLG